MHADDGSKTLDAQQVEGDLPQPDVVALTVAFHPDVSRIGERTHLGRRDKGAHCELSRAAPEFTPPNAVSGRPLQDRFLSRRPVHLVVDQQGVELQRAASPTAVRLDGTAVQDTARVATAALSKGVVIELGDRIVLLLHEVASVPRRRRSYGLVGHSEALQQVRDEIENIAGEPDPVLLRGESGVGKELVAKAIHQASGRAGASYVALNMAAIPQGTATAELFGHERGSFTGAVKQQYGAFRAADGGTLFLDEIGAAGSDVQALLLRALESGEIQPVGGQTCNKVDVRIIAATDAKLEDAIGQGGFRLALLHRLAGYELDIPPLRQRPADIAPLLLHFVREKLDESDELSLLDVPDPPRAPWLPAALVARLMRHEWPGNVRQLRNVARQLVITSRSKTQARLSPAIERLLATAVPVVAPPSTPSSTEPSSEVAASQPSATVPDRAARRTDLDTISNDRLIDTLRRNRFKVAAAARELGISKTSLYQLMERCDQIRKAKDLTAAQIRKAQQACSGDVKAMAEKLEVSTRGLKLRMTELEIE